MAHLCFASKLKLSVTVYLVALTTLVIGQTVDFSINNSSQCFTANQYVFTNNSTAGASAYLWNFGDGTTSTAANPTKSYTNAGNYSVQLIATYNNVNYYVNKTVYVNPAPVCGFNYYAATNTGNSYTFQSTSYISSGYADYTWDFGDSSTANGTNPLHTFGHNGSYTISMTAMSDKGCSCSSTQNITVTVSVPFVMGSMNFSVNNSTQCLTGNSFYFNNNSNNISAATYSWDFGDGSTSTTFSPTHSYSNSGTYVVSLIATVSGNIFTKTQTVTVQPKTSVSISTSATKICKGNTVTYTASANNYYGSPNYQWKVNNVIVGTNSNSFSSTTLSDSDKVNCIMTANNTCWATETDTSNTQIISVQSNAAPVVTIAANTNNICASSTVTITATVANSTYQSSYNFKVNGISTQNSSFNTFTTKLQKDSAIITVETMAGNACNNSALYTSNALILQYNKTSGNIWTGNVDSNFTNTGNWCWGSIPANATIQTVANNRYPVLAGDVTLNNLILNSGTTLVIGNHTLTINGSITGNGNISGGNNSNIIINSTTPNVLNFDTTVTNGNPQNSVNNLTISNGTVTLGTTLNIYGVLSIASGTFDANNMRLKFLSTSTRTACLDKVNDGIHGTIINANNIVVQRYHAARRAWMLISAPLTAAGTNCTGDIYSNWQQNTYITGPASATSGGLDTAVNNTYTMLNWLGTSWGRITDTKSKYTLFGNAGGTTADNKPFLLYVRGDRTVKPTSGGTNSSDVILEAKGALQTGTKIFNLPAGSTYAMVANPYPAPIDLETFRQQNPGMTTFYYWDPKLSTSGGYTTAIYLGGWIFSAVSCTNDKPCFIQSGGAFFVERNGATTAVFNESQKSTSNSSNATFGSNSIASLNIGLSKGSTQIDGVVSLYNNNFSNTIIKGEDAIKLMGNEENISLTKNGTNLSVNAQPEITGTDTLVLNLSKIVAGTTYNFSINGNNLPSSIVGKIIDRYLNTSTTLNLNDSNSFSFNVDTTTASKSANRFIIVFNNKSPLPVTDLKLKGSLSNQHAILNWSVAEETAVTNYAVERSNDGNNFVPIHTTPAFNINNSSYSFTDQQLSAGNYYYRVKMTDTKGGFTYSNTIKITSVNEAGISVYPNPAISNITVHNPSATGILTVSDLNGKVCFYKNINSQNTTLNVSELKQGIYTVTIQNGEQKQTTNLAIER